MTAYSYTSFIKAATQPAAFIHATSNLFQYLACSSIAHIYIIHKHMYNCEKQTNKKTNIIIKRVLKPHATNTYYVIRKKRTKRQKKQKQKKISTFNIFYIIGQEKNKNNNKKSRFRCPSRWQRSVRIIIIMIRMRLFTQTHTHTQTYEFI